MRSPSGTSTRSPTFVEQRTKGQQEPVSVLVAFDRGRQRLLTVLEIGRAGPRGSGPRNAQGLDSRIGAGPDLPARRTARPGWPHRRAYHPRARRVGVVRGPSRRRRDHGDRRQSDRSVAAVRRGSLRDDDPPVQDRQQRPARCRPRWQGAEGGREAGPVTAPAARDEEVRGSELRVPGARRQRGRSGGKVLEGRGARGARRGRARGWLGGSRPARRW